MGSGIRINSHGGVIIGSAVVIDGHVDGLPRIVTHIHSDHTKYLLRSAHKSPYILGTPITLEWLLALGTKINEEKLKPLNFNETFRLAEYIVEFRKAHHIPGTAQVVCEAQDGTRVVYTSDFKKPGKETPIINSDVLVIDAVYGDPSYRRFFDDYIDVLLADFVKETLAKGPVYLHAYYGKVQEVMKILRDEGVDAPFVLDPKQYILAKVLEKHGWAIKDYFLSSSDEAQEVMRAGWYVYFTHLFRKGVNGFGTHIRLSGWEFRTPIKRVNHRWWQIAFSDHADFEGLVYYVEIAKPKVVLVNSVRSTGGRSFTYYLNKKLGIRAYLLP